MSIVLRCLSEITREQVISYHHCLNKLRTIDDYVATRQQTKISNRIEFNVTNTLKSRAVTVRVTLAIKKVGEYTATKKQNRFLQGNNRSVSRVIRLNPGETVDGEFSMITPTTTGEYQLAFECVELDKQKNKDKDKQSLIVQSVEQAFDHDNNNYVCQYHDTFIAFSHRSQIKKYAPASLFLHKLRQKNSSQKRKRTDLEENEEEEDDNYDAEQKEKEEEEEEEEEATREQETAIDFVPFAQAEEPYDLKLEINLDWILNDPELVCEKPDNF